MEMTQLEFFLQVIAEGSFSKAADAVGRTQPAVSIAIRRLEEEVGAPLLDRSQKSPVLTEAGLAIQDYAQRILTLRDQARGAVNELRELKRGLVRVGANESTSLHLLPQVILSFREKHPDVKVEIYRHVSERNDRDLESFCVLRDELSLILNPEHPLAGRAEVTVAELGRESFLAHNVKTASRNKVIEVFAEHHTPLNITLELATVETIKRFVQLKVGLAFVPHMCVDEELERGTLATVRVKGLTYVRTLWATHRRNATHSHAAAAFLAALRHHAKAAA